MRNESSTKPYLIRALYEWCTDNGYTPYVSVAVDAKTVVPREHVRNGEIVLNIGTLATNRLRLGNDLIEFQARFSGKARDISVPVENISAIYARETGQGMAFEVSRSPAVTAGTSPGDATDGPQSGGISVTELAESSAASLFSIEPSTAGQSKPMLPALVPGSGAGQRQLREQPMEGEAQGKRPRLTSVPTEGDGTEPPPRPNGRPKLTVIK